MHINEFFIRFSQVSGSLLSKIKKLTQLPRPFSLNDMFDGFTPSQRHEFLQTDPQLLSATRDWLKNANTAFIHYFHPLYPTLLKTISDPPLFLFVHGNAELLNTPQIAMVGSRRCSEYGQYFANHFAKDLATELTITSGLALGIDGICHRGALSAGGPTIAVLGSGHNNMSPKSHHPLARQIVEKGGAVISEFLPNTQARPHYFPRRNRIISGLSLGIFVIEATLKSGSLITAKYALEQGRELFVLPGEPHSIHCQGNIQLIEDGALAVADPNAIVTLLRQTSLRTFMGTE